MSLQVTGFSSTHLKLSLPRLRPLREDVEDEGRAIAHLDRAPFGVAVEGLLEVTQLSGGELIIKDDGLNVEGLDCPSHFGDLACMSP